VRREPARRLGGELRGLRTAARLSQRDLCAALAEHGVMMTQPTVSRIEAGQTVPNTPEAEAWCDATGASAADRLGVLESVRLLFASGLGGRARTASTRVAT